MKTKYWFNAYVFTGAFAAGAASAGSYDFATYGLIAHIFMAVNLVIMKVTE